MAFDIKNLDVSESDYLGGLENLNNFDKSTSLSGTGIASVLGSGLQAFSGLTMMSDGIDMIKSGAAFTAGVYRSSGEAAVQGSKFQATVLRQAGEAATMAANYNIALDQQSTNRVQDALGRQLTDVISSNAAITAGSGISVASRSAMAVNSDVMTTVERKFVQNKNDSLQRQQMIDYQGKLTQVNYENNARAAEYSGLVQQQQAENNARGAEYEGQVAAYKAKVAQADSIGKSIGSLFSAFGG